MKTGVRSQEPGDRMKGEKNISRQVREEREKREESEIFKRLEGDPSFKIPDSNSDSFPRLKPVKGKGIPASELLVRYRK
jgi:hypothetical protein